MILHHHIACPHCDTLYDRPHLEHGKSIVCSTCHATIDKGVADFRRAYIFALTGVILFIIANAYPFITINLAGQQTTITIISSLDSLFENGLTLLAILVFFLIIITPLWYMLGVVWVVLSFRLNIAIPLTRHFLHLMTRLSPWNMLEVYLVGVLVMIIKVMQIASIQFNYGFWSFCALMVCSILTTYHFDLADAVTHAYSKKDEQDNLH